jgi:hypothetical protein
MVADAWRLNCQPLPHFISSVRLKVPSNRMVSLSGKKSFTEKEIKGGLGSYANLLKQTDLKVDKRITNAIEQIASLHRNPTMHPEMHISNTEILATLGMVVSVIETISIDWNRRKTTPNVPLMDILPDD